MGLTRKERGRDDMCLQSFTISGDHLEDKYRWEDNIKIDLKLSR
jgi:hypothetical protein